MDASDLPNMDADLPAMDADGLPTLDADGLMNLTVEAKEESDDEMEDEDTKPQQFAPPHRLPHHFNILDESQQQPASDFNLLLAFLRIPEIGLEVARYMDAPSILALYSMSGPFHALVNAYMHSVITASTRSHYPWALDAYPFFFMKKFCVPDPAGRRLSNGRHPNQPRWIPGLTWLAMAHFRGGAVDAVWAAMYEAGHRLPRMLVVPAISRMWFLMSTPHNARRVSLAASRRYWPDDVLRAAVLVMLKLDMAMTEPIDGMNIGVLRSLMLGQRSMVPLLRLMLGNMTLLEFEMYRVRWSYQPPAEDRESSILGIPARRVGRGQYEGWGMGTALSLGLELVLLIAADQRELNVHETIIDMVTAGFRDETNNYPGAERVYDDPDTAKIVELWKKKVWFK
jgi:hypothetical protein